MKSKYCTALERVITTEDNIDITILEWIKQQIKVSKNGTIRLKLSDLKNSLGPEFVKIKDYTFYHGLRYGMKKNNILMNSETKKDGTLITILSFYKQKKNIINNNNIIIFTNRKRNQ